MSLAEWFDMGGYALYVWGSFGMTAFCMLLELLLLKQGRKALYQRIARLNRLENQQ